MTSIIPRDLIKHLEWDPKKEAKKPKQVAQPKIIPTKPTIGNIQSSDDFWSISGVQYRDGIYTVDLMKNLLDEGKARTQDQWVEYSTEAQKTGEFYVSDYPLFYQTLRTVFSSKDDSKMKDQAEEIKTTLKGLSRNHWLTTLTRISYHPKGEDVVIHNYGMDDQYKINQKFVGKNGWIKELKNKDTYSALLGTDKISEINETFQWLNGTDAYIFRINEKPKSIDERVARFLADSYRADLYCYGDPSGSDGALGVRATREKS
nr:hypothetical protein [uncultured archaeon]